MAARRLLPLKSKLKSRLVRVARYHSIWIDGAAFTLETSNETSAIIYRYLDETIRDHRQDNEMTLATVTTLRRNIASSEFNPTAIEFQHDAPGDISEHQRLFRCPIKFGAPLNTLTFASSNLSLPIAKADAGLCALLDRHAEELLAKFPPRDSLVDRVRGIIASEFRGGDPSLEHVADQLGLTPRTYNASSRNSAPSTTSCSNKCVANSRCNTCANAKWRFAKWLTCSASPNRAPFIAPSNAGPD